MSKLVSELNNDEIELIVLEQVIENIGLIISPDHDVFARLIASSKSNNVQVDRFVDSAMTLGLLKDGQLDVFVSEYNIGESANKQISLMKTFDLITADVTADVLLAVSTQTTKVADEVRRMLEHGRVFITNDGEFTVIKDHLVTQLAIDKMSKILGRSYDKAGSIINRHGLWLTWCDVVHGKATILNTQEV